jgi:hypothetical protein
VSPRSSVARARSSYAPAASGRQSRCQRCKPVPRPVRRARRHRCPASTLTSTRVIRPFADQERPVSRVVRPTGSCAPLSSSNALLTTCGSAAGGGPGRGRHRRSRSSGRGRTAGRRRRRGSPRRAAARWTAGRRAGGRRRRRRASTPYPRRSGPAGS